MDVSSTRAELKVTIELNESEAKTLWRILQTIPTGAGLDNTEAEFLKSKLVEIYFDDSLAYDVICNYHSSLYSKLAEALED